MVQTTLSTLDVCVHASLDVFASKVKFGTVFIELQLKRLSLNFLFHNKPNCRFVQFLT